MPIPPPKPCPLCGNTVAVNIFLRQYFCFHCRFRESLTTEQANACFRQLDELPKESADVGLEPTRNDEARPDDRDHTPARMGRARDSRDVAPVEQPHEDNSRPFFDAIRKKAGVKPKN